MRPLAAFSIFATLSLIFLSSMLPDWARFIPGGQQDTRLFLWNLWWFPEALSKGLNPFHTPMLFHPFGVSLLSHDYPLWNSVLGYLMQRLGADIVLSANLTFWLTWTMNGFATYLLAAELLRKRTQAFWPAILAGVFVMTHSYTLARMMQNWGQFNLFGLPLFLYALVRLRRTRNLPDAVLTGAALAFNAACHYYFLIYAVSIWLGWLIYKTSPVGLTISISTEKSGWGRKVGFVLAVLGATTAAWITLAHPGAVHIFGQRISLTTPVNALLVMWVGLAVVAVSYAGPQWVSRKVAWTRADWIEQGIVLASAAFFLLPLIMATVQTILSGDYPKQSILWKTHLRGSDLFGLFMPNPLNAWWGPAVTRWFESRAMHPQDQAAMIGWTVLGVVIAAQFWKTRAKERPWLYLAAGSTVMAMGTYLHIGNVNTWLPLPFYVWRLLPVLGNVRVPERWMAVGAVAWAVVLALGVAILCARYPRWRRMILAGAFAFLLIENWPGVPGVPPVRNEPVYETMRALPSGGVLALPFYAGDSSIGTGDALPSRFIFPWDHLGAQIYHQQPIAGGYIGRIPRRLIRHYQQDPLIGRILALEEKKTPLPPLSREEACQAAEALKLDYVLVFQPAIAPEAWKFVQYALPLIHLQSVNDLSLFEIDKVTCLKMINK